MGILIDIVSWLTIMVHTMLQLKDLPDTDILKKFAHRYSDVDSDTVIQFLNILHVGTELSESLDSFLAQHGLLQGRWWVLILLMREDDLTSTPSALAKKSGVSKATMSGLINGLLKDGLITRLGDSLDRRSYSVKLSKLGQFKLDEVMPDYYKRVNKIMGVITAEDRDKMLKSLTLIKAQSNVFE
jgi:DNA-binding MarR family transcriptional regulator